MSMLWTFLIILKINYSAIDVDNNSCQGYYIIILSSSAYKIQEDLNIDGQVICSGEIIFEGT